MKFVGNNPNNGGSLPNYLPDVNEAEDISEVKAAIAYGRNFLGFEGLLENCLKLKLKLNIWMRYDNTVPVEVGLLKKLLANYHNNVFCRLIPNRLHTKVIWWKGYGAYIGSANLSEGAWRDNVEAGVFLSQSELEEHEMDIELDVFFERLALIEKAFPLDKEIIHEMEELTKAKRALPHLPSQKRPRWEGENYITARDKKTLHSIRLNKFVSERKETNILLTHIGEQLAQHKRPAWILDDVPLGWQIDQFLHAYYYERVGSKNRMYETFHERNCSNPQKALLEAIHWWSETIQPPTWEYKTLHIDAPAIQSYLQESKVLSLTKEELSDLFLRTHAIPHHIKQVSSRKFGSHAADVTDKVKDFAFWVFSFNNEKSMNIKELFKYVLYEGKNDAIWERLYNASCVKEWRIPEIALNSIGEIIGWVRPEVCIPRNGRTNKSLRALGYDIGL